MTTAKNGERIFTTAKAKHAETPENSDDDNNEESSTATKINRSNRVENNATAKKAQDSKASIISETE